MARRAHRGHFGIADRADNSASSDGRTASSFRLRLVVDRSLRRLCMALKRLEEASATSRIRLVTASRAQEFQALKPSNPVMQGAIRTMTDLISEDTVKRSSMTPPKASLPT